MANIRISIDSQLHPWLQKMSEITEIRDYSKLVNYLLQRLKDDGGLGAFRPSHASTTATSNHPQTLDIQVDAEW